MEIGEIKIIQSEAVIVENVDVVAEKEKVINELRGIDPATPSLGKAVGKLRDRFNRFGYCGKADNDRLKAEFNSLADSLFEKRDAIWQENLKLYEDIVNQAEALADSKEYKNAKLQMKELRTKWTEISHASKEDEDALWNRFKAAEDKLYANAKQDYEDRLSRQDDGKAMKEEIVRKAQELAASTDLNSAKEQMKALQVQWKETPHAAKEEEDALWAQFRQAADTLFAEVNKEFEERKAKQEEAKKLKEELINQAEEISKSHDFKTAKEQMKALQEQWKNTPRASREDDDALWLRFRQAADRLFENSKKEYENRQVNQQKAKNKKERIISRIEALAILANSSEAAAEVKRLSDEFYEAGSAGKEYNEILRDQLNEAKNHFYSIRRQSSGNRPRPQQNPGETAVADTDEN